MNLLILESHQFISETSAIPNERQSTHIRNILKCDSGDNIRIGVLNGKVGDAIVIYQNNQCVLENIQLNQCAPTHLPITFILGLPRPQMIKRILQSIASIGIRELIFIHTQRVEKSFWQSPVLFDDAIHEQLLLGLEQGTGTYLPKIRLYPSYSVFIKQVLPELMAHGYTHSYVAHPTDCSIRPQLHETDESMLVVGPEGGFITDELADFEHAGFNRIDLGKKILKVETAIPALIGKLYF